MTGQLINRRGSFRRISRPLRRTLPAAMAVSLLAFAATVAGASFTIEPATGPASGGQRVRLEFKTHQDAQSVKIIQFGNRAVSFRKPDASSIEVETPTYDGGGETVSGGFRVPIRINGAETASVFTYLNENKGVEAPTQQEKEASSGNRHVPITIDPAFGTAAGQEEVTLKLEGRVPGCRRPQILFGSIPVSFVPGLNANEFRAVTPRAELPPGQSPMPVKVYLRCDGNVLASGTFLYLEGARSQQASFNVFVAGAFVALVGGLLWWRLRSLESQIRSGMANKSSSQSTAEPNPLFADILAQMKRIEERCRRIEEKLNVPTRGGQVVDTEFSSLPQMDWSVPRAGEEPPLGETAVPEEPPSDSGRSVPRKPSGSTPPASKAHAITSGSAAELTAIWNDANGRGLSDQEFVQLMRAELPYQFEFRSASGLIVVTPKGADSAWVVPAMNPILHRSALLEFFQIHDSGGARRAVTLIRPATMPKDVDINGYTAGQITRGLLEK